MQAIIVAIGVKLAQWILKLGLEALTRALIDFVEEQKKKKINEENEKKHKDDIANNAPPSDKGKSGSRLINGDK